jgi:GT2 family glycosyltransferase
VTTQGITVIVVSRGLEGLLRHGLAAIQRALHGLGSAGRHRVVVVDNASTPPYREGSLPGVKLIRFDRHQSFARANNTAARAYPNDLYLLANNDLLVADETLLAMLEILDRHPHAGVCGTRLVFPDHTIQHCGVVFGDGDRGPYHCFRGTPSELVPRADREWQAVTGACMLVAGPVWAALGGLDEAYPFGLEDIDLCLRARQQGWRVLCSNRTDSLHFESLTPGRARLDVASRALFMRRWRGRYGIDG